jgi:hypothetical protein
LPAVGGEIGSWLRASVTLIAVGVVLLLARRRPTCLTNGALRVERERRLLSLGVERRGR